jgi:sugar phosphate isomerase/epimerase
MCPIQKEKKPGLNKKTNMQNRRTFLKNSGLLAGAIALGTKGWSLDTTQSPLVKNFGIQLYTLRDILPGNAKQVLKDLAGFGYTQIESYEGPEGIYWSMNAKECKNYLDSLGLQLISTHCDINTQFEKKAEEAASIGMKYLICPWIGPQKSIEDYKKFAAIFNEKGRICQQQGVKFAYHNHDYSFKKINGEIPQEILLKETDPSLVEFEMDMYWVVAGGGDPLEWFTKYPGRFTLGHVKDRGKNPVTEGKYESTDLGTGSIDYLNLLPKAKSLGLSHLIMEQEYYPNGSSLKAAELGAIYLKKLRF